jgi:hypothetical protein
MRVPDRRARLNRAQSSLSIRRQRPLIVVARSSMCRTRALANDNDLAPALDRRALHNVAFPGLTTYVAEAATRRSCRQSQADPRADALLSHSSHRIDAANEHAGAGHWIFLYLLRGRWIDPPNQLWAAVGRRFLHLLAVSVNSRLNFA